MPASSHRCRPPARREARLEVGAEPRLGRWERHGRKAASSPATAREPFAVPPSPHPPPCPSCPLRTGAASTLRECAPPCTPAAAAHSAASSVACGLGPTRWRPILTQHVSSSLCHLPILALSLVRTTHTHTALAWESRRRRSCRPSASVPTTPSAAWRCCRARAPMLTWPTTAAS
jgi:hypothetical protein